MNKVLIVLLVLGAGALIYYALRGNIDLFPDVDVDENIDLETVEESLEETGDRTVYASCNDIANTSNCLDYVGSMWNEADSAELNCGENRTFSNNACPYSEFGGCQMNGGTVMEFISWVYEEGPGDYNAESLPYAIQSCNSLNNAKWVTPDSLLEENN